MSPLTMRIRPILLSATLALGAHLGAAAAASGGEPLAACSSCHALSKPANADIDRLMTRGGPDLYYAGMKFNKEWLVAWLQNPSVIRPGGVMFVRTIKPGAPGTLDVIDPTKLTPHPKLDATDAAAAAEALMKLGVGEGLVTAGAYASQPANAMMAGLLFNKLRGCSSCHQATPDTGGLSGPELYTAGQRLQPDYIVEYIRDPQKFDPHVWMPKLELTDGDIQKLAGYLVSLQPKGAK
jgi:cytochrome c553